MIKNYHIDPELYTIQQLKDDLQSRVLIPSRKPLIEGIEEKFEILEDAGNHNLKNLIDTLKNKKKLAILAVATGIDEKYLTLLRREVNSYLPNPVPLRKFSGFPPAIFDKLAIIGLKNSRHLFERIENPDDLQILANETGISGAILSEMVGLADLVRAYGVGPAFSRLLYDTGIQSIAELKKYSPRQVVDLYETQTQKKADFSESDIQFSLDIIKALDIGE